MNNTEAIKLKPKNLSNAFRNINKKQLKPKKTSEKLEESLFSSHSKTTKSMKNVNISNKSIML